MWRNEFRQGFSSSGRRQLGTWHRYYKLGSFSFLGVVMMGAIFSEKKAIAFPTLSTDWQGYQIRREYVTFASERTALTLNPSPTGRGTLRACSPSP
ncbi:MAG: hypothetical protein ICV85_18505, partial [Tolypothrix sp. T3-bin4]|nr:hypothetical protein [Tolypothrix sp. T3-bin4]